MHYQVPDFNMDRSFHTSIILYTTALCGLYTDRFLVKCICKHRCLFRVLTGYYSMHTICKLKYISMRYHVIMSAVKMVFPKMSLKILLSLLRIRNISTPPLAAVIGNSTLCPCSALTYQAACAGSVCSQRAVFATFRYAATISPYLRRAICVEKYTNALY